MRFRLDVLARLRVARLLVAAQFILLGALFLLSILSVHKKVHSYLAFELILALVGVFLIIVATKNLKPSLKISPIPKKDAPLISIGVYKYVRHPMYLAVILIGFSLAGFADSLAGWILEGFLIVTLNVKATFEDALLLELHPQALHFQMHTSKLIPCMGNTCRSSCAFSSEAHLGDSSN
jgi:protein-S-isoprenylcysteine O-methyltransferase Ste14